MMCGAETETFEAQEKQEDYDTDSYCSQSAKVYFCDWWFHILGFDASGFEKQYFSNGVGPLYATRCH